MIVFWTVPHHRFTPFAIIGAGNTISWVVFKTLLQHNYLYFIEHQRPREVSPPSFSQVPTSHPTSYSHLSTLFLQVIQMLHSKSRPSLTFSVTAHNIFLQFLPFRLDFPVPRWSLPVFCYCLCHPMQGEYFWTPHDITGVQWRRSKGVSANI